MSENSLSTTQATDAIVGLLGEGEAITDLTNDESSKKPVEQVKQVNVSEEETGQVEEQPDAFNDDVVTDADLESHAQEVYDDIEQQPVEETQDVQALPTFKVKVNGEEYEVNQDELVAGYQRDSDYRRKTESLSIEKQAFQEETQKKNEEINNRLNTANQAINLAQQQLGLDAKQIEELMATDPVEAQRQLFFLNQKKEALSKQQAEITRQQNVELEKHIALEKQKMLLELPEMRNPETASKKNAEIKSLLARNKFTDTEISQIYDHRIVKIINMAVEYDKMMSKRPLAQRKVQNVPKVVKGGVVQSKEAKQKRLASDKMARLKKTGRTDDATELLKSIFEN